MGNRTSKKALWSKPEVSYSVDPNADGSTYKAVPAVRDGLGELQDTSVLEELDLATGRGHRTQREYTQDGWGLDVTIPMWGNLTASGDGVNASGVSDDVLDEWLLHMLGAQRTTEGEQLATVVDSDSITVSAGDPWDIQDLVPFWDSAGDVPTPPRSQWGLISVDGGTQAYDIAPAFVTNPVAATTIGYGAKIYTFDDDDGGATQAFYYQSGNAFYTLLGGRCVSAVLELVAGRIARLRTSWRGDTKTSGAKGSIVTAISTPIVSPLRFNRSPFFFNGTRYSIQRANIDLGLQVAELASSEGANGRGDDEAAGAGLPTFEVNPEKTVALDELKKNATKGRALLQLGGGVLSGGIMNSMCIHAEQAQVPEHSDEDDNNRRRLSMTFEVSDNVIFSGSTNTRVFQWARA